MTPPIPPLPAQPFAADAAEFGLIRLFAVDLPEDRLKALRIPGDARDRQLGHLLGAPLAHPDRAEVFHVDTLSAMGLPAYLEQAHDVPPELLEPARADLEAQEGTLLLVESAAFGGMSVTMQPDPALRFLGVFPTLQLPPAPITAPARPRPEALSGPASAPPARIRALRWPAVLMAAVGLLILYFLFRG